MAQTPNERETISQQYRKFCLKRNIDWKATIEAVMTDLMRNTGGCLDTWAKPIEEKEIRWP
jgi:hypothetical protein